MNWEYKVIHIDSGRFTRSGLPGDLGQKFDEFGDDGWELVRTESILRGGLLAFGFGTFTRTAGLVAFFKRPKKASQKQ